MTRAVLFFSSLILLVGCAIAEASLDSTNSAELSFAKAGSPDGLSGSFDSIDGKRLEDKPIVVRVPAGEHVVGYSCPDVLSVDLQATAKATFVAGHNYVLECAANEPGWIKER